MPLWISGVTGSLTRMYALAARNFGISARTASYSSTDRPNSSPGFSLTVQIGAVPAPTGLQKNAKGEVATLNNSEELFYIL